MSPSKEYVRQLQGANFAKRKTLWQWLRVDPLLLFLLLSLASFGLLVLYSASTRDLAMVRTQAAYMGVGLVILLVLAQVPPLFFRRTTPLFYFLGLFLLLLVLLVGEHSKGAQRWLSIPGLPRFQPAELMKIVMPIMAARYLASRILPPKPKYILAILLMVAVPSLLIAKQPDLGTAILVGSSGLFALLLSGILWRYIFGAGILVTLSAWPAWQFVLHDYQRTRILTLLDPESDRFGAGWNILQSKTAIGSGGWSGAGWLNGTQSQLDFLPEGHTDFILAVLAEEWGLLGVTGLLLLYFAIIARVLVLAWAADTLFNKLVVAGFGLTFFVYIFVNVGMVSGMLPVVGIPLPFISRGGTSIISLMMVFGIIMSCSVDKQHFLRN